MGLDFTISETKYIGLDEQGRNKYETIELENFGHTGYTIMDYCTPLNCMANCSTVSIDAVELLYCLDDMKKSQAECPTTELEYAIDELGCFLESEKITEDSDRVFDIHIWY